MGTTILLPRRMSTKLVLSFPLRSMASDMVNLGPLHNTIRFKLGKPFLPFYQLLGCLPRKLAVFAV